MGLVLWHIDFSRCTLTSPNVSTCVFMGFLKCTVEFSELETEAPATKQITLLRLLDLKLGSVKTATPSTQAIWLAPQAYTNHKLKSETKPYKPHCVAKGCCKPHPLKYGILRPWPLEISPHQLFPVLGVIGPRFGGTTQVHFSHQSGTLESVSWFGVSFRLVHLLRCIDNAIDRLNKWDPFGYIWYVFSILWPTSWNIMLGSLEQVSISEPDWATWKYAHLFEMDIKSWIST